MVPWCGKINKHWAGEPVKGRFVCTIHSINCGILELAKLSFPTTIYRGISCRLPVCFTKSDDQGVRAGCDMGFMSTTLKKDVATGYAGVENKTKPSALVVAEMKVHHRGAVVDWLSQYGDEVINLTPATPGLWSI